MILNHIAIIVSSEKGVDFYKALGFEEVSREIRDGANHDVLVYLTDKMTTLEIYVDPTHPKRVTSPEAYGLRHLCFEVERIDEFAGKWGAEVKEGKSGRFCFIYDPDGLPIEIKEMKMKRPEGDYEC